MAGAFSNQVFSLVDSYTNDSIVNIPNTKIQSGASGLMNTLISAHDDDDFDITGDYEYYSDISSSPNDATLGINPLKDDSIKTKVRESNTVFNFKNSYNDKYIIVYNQKAFVFDTEADWDNVFTSFKWRVGAEAYTPINTGAIMTQYQNSIAEYMTNDGQHSQ